MVTNFTIRDRKIGPGAPCFVIAEAGVNHNGDIELAKKLVEAAAAAGADAVKFQTFAAERLATATAPKADYQKRTTGTEESQFEMLKKLELSEEAHAVLLRHCEKHGILFLSTPFDEKSADLLRRIGVAAIKTPSGELTNLPYLGHVASFGLPLIVSTGMANLAEVEAAVGTIAAAGAPPLSLLHCVSNYPTAPAEVNLRAMATLAAAFGVPVGFSDHTEGNPIALAAVARGACVIEKHLTLDRTLPGPDHQASIEPEEFAALVRGIRAIELALGDGRKRPTAGETKVAAVARRSVVAAHALPAGRVLALDDLALRRPGTGLAPAMLPQVVGRKLKLPVQAGDLLAWSQLE